MAYNVLSQLVTCETKYLPPTSTCAKNIKFHSPVEGPILGHMYSTLWLGTNGLDGVNIKEFVPLSYVSPDASAMVIKGSEEDFSAAEAIMSLGHE